MSTDQLKEGMKVRTVELKGEDGFLIHPRHLQCRKAGINGTLRGYVAGHGGDVWWIHHDGSTDVGAYSLEEFEELER